MSCAKNTQRRHPMTASTALPLSDPPAPRVDNSTATARPSQRPVARTSSKDTQMANRCFSVASERQ